jgi:D-alanyl-D-alanine-carboxypeptidase/D-alanyl-D-alanine-endopeptidase
VIPPPPPAYLAEAAVPALPAEIELALRKLVGTVPGGVVVVGRRLESFGRVDDLVGQRAPRPNAGTRFETGAVTEALTGMLLADAVRRGEVQLDDPIAGQISTTLHPPARGGKQITFRDLATHRSGLPRLPLREAAQPYAGYDRSALIALVNGAHLTADPGSRYDPSNVDFALLGMLLADRAGVPYAELARNRIFTPLDMGNSTADESADDRLAPEWAITGNAVAPWRWGAFAPDGGMRSTVDDLLRFTDAFSDEGSTPLGKDARLSATPIAEAGPDAGIGLGWLVDRAGGAVYASGWTYGATAFVGIVPARNVAVVLLTNVGIGFAGPTLDDIGRRLLALSPARAAVAAPQDVEPLVPTLTVPIGR